MDVATYRRNVVKSASVKPTKAGLRYTARNTQRTNILHMAIGLATEVGELVQAMTGYLLVGRMTAEEQSDAFDNLEISGFT